MKQVKREPNNFSFFMGETLPVFIAAEQTQLQSFGYCWRWNYVLKKKKAGGGVLNPAYFIEPRRCKDLELVTHSPELSPTAALLHEGSPVPPRPCSAWLATLCTLLTASSGKASDPPLVQKGMRLLRDLSKCRNSCVKSSSSDISTDICSEHFPFFI